MRPSAHQRSRTAVPAGARGRKCPESWRQCFLNSSFIVHSCLLAASIRTSTSRRERGFWPIGIPSCGQKVVVLARTRLKRTLRGLALPASSAPPRSRCLDEHLPDVVVTHGAQSSRRVTVLLESHRPPNHSRARLTLPATRSQRVLVQEHDHLLRRACSIVCVHCLTVVLTLARMLAVSIVPCATSVRRLVCSCFLMHGTVHKRVDV